MSQVSPEGKSSPRNWSGETPPENREKEPQLAYSTAKSGTISPPIRRIFVVLPAYNEEENLGPLLDGIAQTMAEENFPYQVILVDDGSQDGTVAIALARQDQMPIRIERHPQNQGLGRTIADGLRLAAADAAPQDIIITMDADNTHPPGLMGAMIRAVREGRDLVIASRYQPGARVLGVPRIRRFFSWAASRLFRLVFPIPSVWDYTCGYRAYRAALLQEAFGRYGDGLVSEAGFACMVELLLKLHKLGAICGEVPLILRYDRKAGRSKMQVGRTIGRTLRLLVRHRFCRFKSPGIAYS
ncbi:MAG: glycosyltransferase [Thermoguttaceae bacterium]|nr:glycosyltransferase [Thermoguttaceae bacterium]MDW8039694.1 glycosyltransferase [Thermoguttaceae bacterium]